MGGSSLALARWGFTKTLLGARGRGEAGEFDPRDFRDLNRGVLFRKKLNLRMFRTNMRMFTCALKFAHDK